jgi:hypothetical protein
MKAEDRAERKYFYITSRGTYDETFVAQFTQNYSEGLRSDPGP